MHDRCPAVVQREQDIVLRPPRRNNPPGHRPQEVFATDFTPKLLGNSLADLPVLDTPATHVEPRGRKDDVIQPVIHPANAPTPNGAVHDPRPRPSTGRETWGATRSVENDRARTRRSARMPPLVLPAHQAVREDLRHLRRHQRHPSSGRGGLRSYADGIQPLDQLTFDVLPRCACSKNWRPRFNSPAKASSGFFGNEHPRLPTCGEDVGYPTSCPLWTCSPCRRENR